MTANIINYLANREKERSNRMNEFLRHSELSEATRHNRAMESLEGRKQRETQRANQASESIRSYEAKTERDRARTYSRSVTDTFISNLRGHEIERSKVAVQARYNTGQLAIAARNLNELERHNKEQESLQLRNLLQTYELDTRRIEATEQANVLQKQKTKLEHERGVESNKVQREGNWLRLAGNVIQSGMLEKAGSKLGGAAKAVEQFLILGY